MKLDPTVLRYLTRDDMRVLVSVEMGMRNHELVPVQLISSIAALRHGGVQKSLVQLLRHKLVHHDRSKYDGYRLTNAGYDILALKAMVNRGTICGIGRQIGVGKESDIFVVVNDQGEEMALKLHRLGRTSFRAVKEKRDYVQHRKTASWLYLSRLAAVKEFAFMKALHEHGFPVPTPVDQCRHCVVMSLCDGLLMTQMRKINDVERIYDELMALIRRIAQCGLVHGDFNEFNIMLSEREEITLIDFPQMVSTSHLNAEELFDRDVRGVTEFFRRKLHYVSEQPPPRLADVVADKVMDLDVEVQASGFSKETRTAFDALVHADRDDAGDTRHGVGGGDGDDGTDGGDDVEGGATGDDESKGGRREGTGRCEAGGLVHQHAEGVLECAAALSDDGAAVSRQTADTCAPTASAAAAAAEEEEEEEDGDLDWHVSPEIESGAGQVGEAAIALPPSDDMSEAGVDPTELGDAAPSHDDLHLAGGPVASREARRDRAKVRDQVRKKLERKRAKGKKATRNALKTKQKKADSRIINFHT